jgi:hypothetical protein
LKNHKKALISKWANPKGTWELKPFLLELTLGEHRMFSNRIANSARFLQMPTEAQLLYFHFILRADDDGIVESYPILKLLGIPSDNYKLLIVKGYIRELNEDQVIVITDWLEHNTIRADRKINSIYLPLMQNKFPELPFIEPKPRSDVKDNSKRLSLLSTDSPRTEEVKLSKVKLSKDNISESFKKFWDLYDKKRNRKVTENLWKKVNPELHDFIYKHIEQYKKVQPEKLYRKDPERYLKYECWNDEVIQKEDKQQPEPKQKTVDELYPNREII